MDTKNNDFLKTYFQNFFDLNNEYFKSNFLHFFNAFNNCHSYLPEEFNSRLQNMNDTKNHTNLNLFSFNCRSLINKLDDISYLLNTIGFGFDVLTFSETWLNNTNENYATIPNFFCIPTNRVHKSGGGIAFFVSNDVTFFHRDDIYMVSPHFEVDVIEILKNNNYFFIVNVYRPPITAFDLFFDSLTEIFKKLIKENKTIYLTGDFNINLYVDTSQARTFLDICSSFSLFPTIYSPTRIGASSETLIDNILTNNKNYFINGTIFSDLSDHFPIFLIQSIHLKSKKPKKKYMNFHNFSKNNLLNLIHSLYNYSWNDILSIEDCNHAFNTFLISLESLIHNSCPITRKKNKKI